jgi:hypothetical protein
MFLKNYIFWDIRSCSSFKVIDVSEDNVASIFSVKQRAKQELRLKAGGKELSRWFLA